MTTPDTAMADGIVQLQVDPITDWTADPARELIDGLAGFAILAHHQVTGPQYPWPQTAHALWALHARTIDGQFHVLFQRIGVLDDDPIATLQASPVSEEFARDLIALVLTGQDWVEGTIPIAATLGGDVRLVMHAALVAFRSPPGRTQLVWRPNDWVGDDPDTDPAVRLDAIAPEGASDGWYEQMADQWGQAQLSGDLAHALAAAAARTPDHADGP